MATASTARTESSREFTPSEHEIQSAFFDWAQRQIRLDDRYQWIFAVPNGGERHPAVAAKLRREGVKPGCPDVLIDYPVAGPGGVWCPGARIEFKKPKGRTTEHQDHWLVHYSKTGYAVAVAFDWQLAAKFTSDYFAGRIITGRVHQLRA
jgi:hypothetical protein